MALVTIFLLLGPGIIVWKIGENKSITNAAEIVRMLLSVILDSFIVMMCAYITLTAIYGYMALNLSDVFIEGFDNSIFNVSFVWKYGLLSGGYGVALGLVQKIFLKIRARRSGK